MRWHRWFSELSFLRFPPAGLLATLAMTLWLMLLAPFLGLSMLEPFLLTASSLVGGNYLQSSDGLAVFLGS